MAAVRAHLTTPQRKERPTGLEVAGDAVSAERPPVLALQAAIAEAFDSGVSDRWQSDVKFIHPGRLALIGALALVAWMPVAAIAAAWLA